MKEQMLNIRISITLEVIKLLPVFLVQVLLFVLDFLIYCDIFFLTELRIFIGIL